MDNMKSTFTKGEWRTGAVMTTVEVLPKGWRMPMRIADCDMEHSPEDKWEKVANARLIASAPKLYSACVAIRACLQAEAMIVKGCEHKWDLCIDVLDKAINQAEGE
jgi:hypothetical protein